MNLTSRATYAAETNSKSMPYLSLFQLDLSPDPAEFINLEALGSLQHSAVDIGNDHIEERLNLSEVEFVSQ
jgi:hypothetical protein